MDTIYQTSDGERFKGVTGEIDALDHQRRIDSLGRPDPNYVDHAKNNREEACSNLNKASACVDNGEYEKAIELCNNNMTFLNAVGKSEEVPPKILANAYNTRGVAYDKLGNKEQAIADFKKALDLDYKHEYAKRNLANALANQGNAACDSGDYARAVELYRKAADMGNAMAVCNLGVRYYTGQGVPKDINKALELFHKSADMGYAPAMHNLGCFYRDGIGVTKDDAKAVEFFQKAVEHGNTESMIGLGMLYYSGKGKQKDETKAFELWRKAAENGNAKAMNNVGECYRDGIGVKPDLAKAKEWYSKAVSAGHEGAKAELAKLKQMRGK